MRPRQVLLSCSSLFAFAFARPTSIAIRTPDSLLKREVPQEHSHEKFLTTVRASLALDNPAGIVDPVFGLLGNAAAAGGQGSIADTDCLQQATADQAFTNAKAAGDVNGMTAALVYRALERNTGTVGGISAACTSIEPANPEIAAISQHQDPASANAAATNKAIALALAMQIASVGGDPQTAIQSGTFEPGSITDNTGKGNSCNDANDAEGCIFSQNLLVADVTAAEIDAAVGSASTGATPANAPISTAAASGVPVPSAVSASAPFVNSTDATTTAAAADLDFGSCNNPGIVFGPGFDGRKEDSFEPADTVQFTHGSALNIGVITGFIQDRLKDNCKASQQAITAAQSAAAATKGLVGQAAADAWNNGLGLSSAPASNNAANATSAEVATGSTNVDSVNTTGQASKSGKSDKAGKAGKANKADKPPKPSEADKSNKADKANNADKAPPSPYKSHGAS